MHGGLLPAEPASAVLLHAACHVVLLLGLLRGKQLADHLPLACDAPLLAPSCST